MASAPVEDVNPPEDDVKTLEGDAQPSAPPTPTGKPEFTSTVIQLNRNLGDEERDAWEIVLNIFSMHREYGANKAAEFDSSLSGAPDEEKKTMQEWLDEVISLYDLQKVTRFHGRLVVFGLALLEPALAKQLNAKGFLTALEAEIKEPLWDILSPRGLRLYLNDAVTSHTDNPARIDLLGRKAFADALAIRLRRSAAEFRSSDPPQSFMLNLNGPWGAGKTSLLNFLGEALKKEAKSDKVIYQGWVVVNFNAWKHQRVGLSWWSLLDAVFRESVRQLWRAENEQSFKRRMRKRLRAIWLWTREYMWRLKVGRAHYFLTAALVFGALALVLYFNPDSIIGLFTSDDQKIEVYGKRAEGVTKMIALASGLITTIIAVSRSLLSGSARAARDFMNTGHDPMNDLARHFSKLVDSIKQPVAIFVDDLDRCQSTYVVDLIEGIQTLCRDTAVTFVIAADRRWICSSYAKAYDSFASYVDEPGRPLGYLFLDKIFQLSTSIPRMSVDIQTEYWKRLLSGSEATIEKRLREAEAAAKKKVRSSRTEAGAVNVALANEVQDPYELQALRGAAVLRLASQEVEAEIEHALKEFAPLLEPNPRAMKRLINAYSVQRAIATLAGVNVRREQLALWTIASLRWPLLAEFLEEQPGKVQFLGCEDPKTLQKEIPLYLRKLFQNAEVLDVFNGEGIGASLDMNAIKTCASLRAAGSGATSVVA